MAQPLTPDDDGIENPRTSHYPPNTYPHHPVHQQAQIPFAGHASIPSNNGFASNSSYLPNAHQPHGSPPYALPPLGIPRPPIPQNYTPIHTSSGYFAPGFSSSYNDNPLHFAPLPSLVPQPSRPSWHSFRRNAPVQIPQSSPRTEFEAATTVQRARSRHTDYQREEAVPVAQPVQSKDECHDRLELEAASSNQMSADGIEEFHNTRSNEGVVQGEGLQAVAGIQRLDRSKELASGADNDPVTAQEDDNEVSDEADSDEEDATNRDEDSDDGVDSNDMASRVDNYYSLRRAPGTSGLGKLLEEHEPKDDETVVQPAGRRKTGPRGPRKAVEPTGDIKLRLGRANNEFAELRIEEAEVTVREIIRINAETFEAWLLLSSIFQDQGKHHDALMALIVAAHLRPKHLEAWFNAADYALHSMGETTEQHLRDAQWIYASAIRNIPTSIEARREKANVSVMRGLYRSAAGEYRHILKLMPHDLATVRELAILYIDINEPRRGWDLYKTIFNYFRSNTELEENQEQLNWNDLHSYAVLYGFMGMETNALKELKSHARWLIGREEETFWDEATDDDCEWDLYDSRRRGISRYTPAAFPSSYYGLGLPIELRVDLGKFRLRLGHYEEALRHFSWLYVTDGARESHVSSHPHLVLEVAGLLEESGHNKDALVFYKALKLVPGQMEVPALIQMAKCLLKEERNKEAKHILLEVCKMDASNIEARVQLARLFEKMDEAEQAFAYVNQVLDLESARQPKLYRRRLAPPVAIAPKPAPQAIAPVPAPAPETVIRPNPKPVVAPRPAFEPKVTERASPELTEQDLEIEEAYYTGHLRDKYRILVKETEAMRRGDHQAITVWMDCARALTEDFRSCKAFYPWERKEFDGYTKEEQREARRALESHLAALSQRHAKDIGAEILDPNGIPTQYRGISFREWLDIFMEYALCLAGRGRNREAYDVCEAAIHAIIFCFSREDMFALHVCYCRCALLANDEETCVGIARWFMVQFQFTTDSYRMFGAISRMCHSPVSWYNSGPTQKFMLRQIKAMDYSLASDERKEKFYKEKAGYSQRDEKGDIVINTDLDIALLMTYAHILSTSSSYGYAMNYYYRAYALDPKNPMINLSLGLACIQQGLKRQSDNRQHGIMQGLTFMHSYYDSRKRSPHVDERQEAHYNMARTYQLLGLVHLAVPYYQKVLDGTKEADGSSDLEGIVIDTAYNLQTLYVTVGNIELADKITREWLVI